MASGFSGVEGQPLFAITLDEGVETLYKQWLFGSALELLAARDLEIQLFALVAHRLYRRCGRARKMPRSSRSVSVLYDFEKTENPTIGIENGNRLTGVFNKLYRALDRLFGVREIVDDQGYTRFDFGSCAVKLLSHGCGNGEASL